MKYILLIGEEVAEIIPEFNPDLPGFTVSERYSPEFVSKLIAVDDDVPVEQNWIYRDGVFVAPPEPEPEPEPSGGEELEQRVDEITALQLAVAELAEAQAADQTANELALAELAEIVLGG